MITSSVPGYCSSHCSSHSTASRSRWLVGSSSSSRSLGVISARATFRRTRQPPEKSDTGLSWVSGGKPEAVQQPAGARAGVVAVDLGQLLVARLGDRLPVLGWRWRPPRPGPHACTSASPDSTKSIAGSGSDGVSCATLAMRSRLPAGRGRRVGLDLAHRSPRTGSILPQPLRPTTPTRAAGVQGQVDVGQQQAFAAPQGEISEGDHGDAGLSGARSVAETGRPLRRARPRSAPVPHRGGTHRIPAGYPGQLH